MGGFLSLWAAAESIGIFGKVISIDGLPYYPVLAMPGISPETAGPVVEMMQSNMANLTPEAARAQQEMMITTMISDPAKREVVLEMGMKSNPDVISRAMGEMYTTDIRKQVSAIGIPVLALGSWYGYSQYDVIKESASAGYLAQFGPITNATFKMAAKALHFIFYDDPDWFFEVVDGFLEETFFKKSHSWTCYLCLDTNEPIRKMKRKKIYLGLILIIMGLIGMFTMLTMDIPLPSDVEALLNESYTPGQIRLLLLINPSIL